MIALFAALLSVAAADPRVVEGERLYGELEFEQAVVVLQDAIAAGALPKDERARALIFLGLSQAQIGKSAAAQLSFTSAFRAAPDIEIPVEVPPKIQSLVDAARKDAATVVAGEPQEGGLSLPLVVGGAGGVVLAGGLTAVGLSLVRYSEAIAPGTTQRNAQRLGDEANTIMAIGAGVSALGAVIVGTAVALSGR